MDWIDMQLLRRSYLSGFMGCLPVCRGGGKGPCVGAGWGGVPAVAASPACRWGRPLRASLSGCGRSTLLSTERRMSLKCCGMLSMPTLNRCMAGCV